MKKIMYTFAAGIIMMFAACDKNEVNLSNNNEVATTGLTVEQQKMRNALEKTTDILLSMISSDQSYIEELNKVIVAGSSEYLEDRVMLKDLFSSTSKSSALRVKANTNKFTEDFKTAFSENKPRKTKGIDDVNLDIFSNPGFLIQYLVENDVILNCPYPLEDYEEDNRIPAISFDPMNNDSVNVGYLFDKSGSVSEVQVSQSYADKHPVWILIPNQQPQEKNQSASNTNTAQRAKAATTDGFRTTINKIYLTEYYTTIFVANLNMRILRSGDAFSWNDQTKNYTGSFSQMNTFQMPRKYVGYAKDQKMSGWYPVNIEWDYDWYSDKKEQALSVYEHDNGNTITLSSTIKVKISDVEVGATISGSFTNTDDIIVLQPLGRDYLYNIATKGHKNSYGSIDWKWTEVTKRNVWGTPTATKEHTHIDGKYIYRFGPSFMMTFSVR